MENFQNLQRLLPGNTRHIRIFYFFQLLLKKEKKYTLNVHISFREDFFMLKFFCYPVLFFCFFWKAFAAEPEQMHLEKPVPVVARSCMHCVGIKPLDNTREISDCRNRTNICIGMFCGGCIGTINRCESLPACTIPCELVTCNCLFPFRMLESFACGLGWCFMSQDQQTRRDLDSAIRFRPIGESSVHGVLCSNGCCCTSCAGN